MNSRLAGLAVLICTSLAAQGMQERPWLDEFELATDPTYENCFRVGVYRLATGDIHGGIDLLKCARRAKREADYYLGVAFYRLGDYAEARSYLTRFIAHRDDVWQSYYYLCLISLKEDNINDAVHFLERVSDERYGQGIAEHIHEYGLLTEARRRYSEGSYEQAIELYKKVDDFPEYAEFGMALALARMGRYKEGLALLERVIAEQSDEQLVLRGLFEAGEKLVLLQELQRAKRYLSEYLSRVQDERAMFLMGRIYSEEAKYDSAIVYLQALPDTVDGFLFFKGRTEYFLGQWAEAEQDLLGHRGRFPGSAYADRVLYILGSLGFRRKVYDRAIRFWQELVDRFPTSPYAAAALQGIGNSHFETKEYASALAAYYRVAAHTPPEQISKEVGLRIYETRYHLREFPSLIDALRRYLRDNPESDLTGRVILRIARIHYERGEYYQSIHELDKIIQSRTGASVATEARILRIEISRAMEDDVELKRSLRSLLDSDSPAEYRLYAANELGAFWVDKMRYDSALYYYNLLLESGAYRESALLKIASIYGHLGQNRESIAMVERLTTDYPQSTYFVDASIVKVHALKNGGDYASALEILEELRGRAGARADVYMELGDMYSELEEFASARENYARAGDLYGNNHEGVAEALIRAGDASVAIGDRSAGREFYLRASMITESTLLKNRAIQKLTVLGEK